VASVDRSRTPEAVDALIDAGGNLFDRQIAEPGSRKLDRQRETVEAAAEGGGETDLAWPEFETGADG
jgi:hypothetical protein